MSADEEKGYLWRLNNYWSYEEGDGGLYIQVESVSLSRAVPKGLGWAIGPFVNSVPRESLEFTLAGDAGCAEEVTARPHLAKLAGIEGDKDGRTDSGGEERGSGQRGV